MLDHYPTWQKVLIIVLVLIGASVLLSIAGSLLWGIVRVLVPIAIIVWLVRVIAGDTRRRR